MWWGELRAGRLRVRAGEDEGRCELGCVLGWTRVGGTWHEECTLECFVVLRVIVCLCVCVCDCVRVYLRHGHAWLCSCVFARRLADQISLLSRTTERFNGTERRACTH